MSRMTLESRHETATFGARRWFVLDEMFTSKEDADAAIRLAYYYAAQERERIGDELRKRIDEVLP